MTESLPLLQKAGPRQFGEHAQTNGDPSRVLIVDLVPYEVLRLTIFDSHTHIIKNIHTLTLTCTLLFLDGVDLDRYFKLHLHPVPLV